MFSPAPKFMRAVMMTGSSKQKLKENVVLHRQQVILPGYD
jgi:hypothetical protein